MKLAILFRGPLRPNINSVIEKRNLLLSQFDNSYQITTFLATWNNWKNVESKNLLGQGLFDTVISQPMPSINRVKQFVHKSNLPSSTQTYNVFNMYYQSLTALNVILNQDDYDFVIHTRTDCSVVFGKDLPNWFDPDHYVTDYHNEPAWWRRDMVTVGPPKLMYSAWNYETLENLGKMIDNADISERIIDININKFDVKNKTAKLESVIADPNRNDII